VGIKIKHTEEEMSLPMITINSFDPTTYKVLGSFVAHHTETVSFGRELFAQVKGTFGGPSDLYKKKMNDTIQKALDTFKLGVKSQYKDATFIIGLRINIFEFNSNTENQGKSIGNALGWAKFIKNIVGGSDDFIPESFEEAPELEEPEITIQEGGGGTYIVATVVGNVLGPK
jgi:uncharacterized protein YbjQ (UPF0145 family)